MKFEATISYFDAYGVKREFRKPFVQINAIASRVAKLVRAKPTNKKNQAQLIFIKITRPAGGAAK